MAVSYELEDTLFAGGYRLVAGMDEVGRGCLAGPVMVGVTVIGTDEQPEFYGLKDSKQMTVKARERLAPIIQEALACAVGEATAGEIDKYGITEALRIAGVRALQQLAILPEVIILDGTHNWLGKGKDFPLVHTQAKADTTSVTAAAASVVAKVTRDKYMETLAYEYPDYLWHKNKGYGTKAHKEAIKEFGVTEYHRKTWKLI
ncbi:MAG: ribonuclease HII [Micrococcaceae bacterium]